MTIIPPASLTVVTHKSGRIYLRLLDMHLNACLNVETGDLEYSISDADITPLPCPYLLSQATLNKLKLYFHINTGEVYLRTALSTQATNLKTGKMGYLPLNLTNLAPQAFKITLSNEKKV